MLSHELPSHKGGLLLSLLMLEDASRNCHPVSGVDQVVSYESRHLADDGHKALLGHLGPFWGVSHALDAPHCNVHLFSPPPNRRRGRRVPPQVDQRAQCEGIEGLTQLRRNRERRSSKNFPFTH